MNKLLKWLCHLINVHKPKIPTLKYIELEDDFNKKDHSFYILWALTEELSTTHFEQIPVELITKCYVYTGFNQIDQAMYWLEEAYVTIRNLGYPEQNVVDYPTQKETKVLHRYLVDDKDRPISTRDVVERINVVVGEICTLLDNVDSTKYHYYCRMYLVGVNDIIQTMERLRSVVEKTYGQIRRDNGI